MNDIVIQRGLPESVRLPFETRDFGITPFFKHLAPLNVAKSEEAGREVYDPIIEVVELQLAGDRNYSPVVPADSMARKVGTRVITFAELYSDQYHSFIMGDNQVAGGTALELLSEYGMTPAQLSVCRALKIYSIEALDQLDGPKLKGLGMSANDLKAMARRYMDERQSRAALGKNVSDLEAEIVRLKALVEPQKDPAEIDALVAQADDEFAGLDDEALKNLIAEKTGQRPRGSPRRDTLVRMANEIRGAA